LPQSREQKEERVERLAGQFRDGQVIVWTDYRGLAVSRLNELRRTLRPHEADFHVIKNTLAELALKRAGLPVPEEMLDGPTAATVFYGEIGPAARALTEFAAANRELVIKGGLAQQRLLQAVEVSALATLPSREVLLAQVLAGFGAPAGGLVNVLAGALRGLVNVLQAQQKKLEEAGA
jgi:large subunit ribosomal protein L10